VVQRLVSSSVAFLVVGVVAVSVSSSVPTRAVLAQGLSSPSNTITLRCSDSAGQQGRGGTTIGGVEGLVLPGSGDPSNLEEINGAHGRHFFIYKAFLAVSSSSAPYVTVSVVRPESARMYYGSSSVVGALMSVGHGRAFVAASRNRVRLPVCGPRFTGYVGGIVVVAPTWVTCAVSAPRARTKEVRVSIGAS